MLEKIKAGEGVLGRLILVYLLWNAAGVLGGSLIYLYFKDAGVGVLNLVISFLFWAVAPIIVIHAFDKRNLSMRSLFIAGILVQALSYLLLAAAPPSTMVLYAFSFLVGVNSFLFWVPFNTMFFELCKGREASLSSVYFAINPIFGVFLPIAGGFIAQSFGFSVLFAAAFAAYLVVLPLALFSVGKRNISFSLGSCLSDLRGFRSLVLVEGAYGGGIAASVTVISLLYFTTPSELGLFLSATTLMSVLASFVVSRISDRFRKRRRFITYSGSALSLATVVAGLATSAIGWTSAISLRNFTSAIFYPFTTAIILDKKRDVKGTMVAREWLLNYGRVAGISLVVFSSIALSDIHLSLLLLGLVILTYPLLIVKKQPSIPVD